MRGKVSNTKLSIIVAVITCFLFFCMCKSFGEGSTPSNVVLYLISVGIFLGKR